MAWQKFLCFADGKFVGSFDGLSREEALKHYQHRHPSAQIEVL